MRHSVYGAVSTGALISTISVRLSVFAFMSLSGWHTVVAVRQWTCDQ